jgi:hypothetical protein
MKRYKSRKWAQSVHTPVILSINYIGMILMIQVSFSMLILHTSLLVSFFSPKINIPKLYERKGGTCTYDFYSKAEKNKFEISP